MFATVMLNSKERKQNDNKIKRPNDRSDEPKPKRADTESDSRAKTRGRPDLLASIPRKEGETPEEFADVGSSLYMEIERVYGYWFGGGEWVRQTVKKVEVLKGN